MSDNVNNPKHYTSHPSGIECIQVTEHMGFNLGNAIKYIWRADLKADAIEDMQKAVWYIQREIAKRQAGKHWLTGEPVKTEQSTDPATQWRDEGFNKWREDREH